MTKAKRLRLVCLLLAVVCLRMLVVWPPQRALAEAPSGGSPEERALREAVAALGWPDTVSSSRVFDMEPDDEAMCLLWPPSSGLRHLAASKVSANNGGSYDEGNSQYARILNLGEEGSRFYLDKLVENGLKASSYQGRNGVVMRVGEPICNPGGLVGYLASMVQPMIAGLYAALGVPNAGPVCPSAAAGVIIWSCDGYTFVARDDSGAGAEDAIAAALYLAAQNQGLCDLGDTLVILAGTDDVAGARPLSHFQQLAQETNSYYGQNAYGRVALSYTFMDADGEASAGPGDWYNVGGAMADWASKEEAFATAAVQKAYEGGAPREEINLARVIVVYAGQSQQVTHDAASPAPLSTVCVWPTNGRWHEIEVGPAGNRSTLYVGSLITVAEEDGLGLWAHEVGHTLYSRHILSAKWFRINDRYNYQQPWGQFGDIDNWGLMGSGNWWGEELASNPVHMMSFSKEGAGWLSYETAELDTRYTLQALEKGPDATALQIDDPNSANPEWYYLLEARQAGGWYGAPESGVVLYQVFWSGTHKHHTVNVLTPQGGNVRATGLGGRSYLRATLAASDRPVYRSPSRRLEFRIHSEDTSDGYSAVVSVSVYTPTSLVGATVTPAAAPAPAAPPTVTANVDGPLPDIDLHAYDDQGRHVGLNYETGEYENQIPGAIASGNLQDAEEWIYVPEGTNVRFEVSAIKTEQFLAANPAYRGDAKPHKFDIEYGRFDQDGNHTVAGARRQEVASGQTTAIPSPYDPDLRWKPARTPGYGRNWPANPYWVGFIGAILLLGLGGWIAGLVRR